MPVIIPQMNTLDDLIAYLESNIEHSASDMWTALHLSVGEAKTLLPDLKRAQASRKSYRNHLEEIGGDLTET